MEHQDTRLTSIRPRLKELNDNPYHSTAKDRGSYAHKLSSEFKNHRKYGFINSKHDNSKDTKVLIGAFINNKDLA